MAVASDSTRVDDVKLVEETEGSAVGVESDEKESEKRYSLTISRENVDAFPFLGEMDAVLIRKRHSLRHILVYTATHRQFEISLDKDNLVSLGFHPRDSVDDCMAILKDAYEKDASETGIRRNLSVATMAITRMRTEGEGEPIVTVAVTAAADDSVTTVATMTTPKSDDSGTGMVDASFDECNAVKVLVIEDIGRRVPFEYLLLLTETELDESAKQKLIVDQLQAEICRLKKELQLSKQSVNVTLVAVGTRKVDWGVARVWAVSRRHKGVCPKLLTLAKSDSTLVICMDGVYKFEPDMEGSAWEKLYVNDDEKLHWNAVRRQVTEEFSLRLCACVRVMVRTSDTANQSVSSIMTVTKL